MRCSDFSLVLPLFALPSASARKSNKPSEGKSEKKMQKKKSQQREKAEKREGREREREMRDISYRHISGSVERFCDKALTLNATARSTSLPNPPPSPPPFSLLPLVERRGRGRLCGKLGWQKVNRRHRLSPPASGTETGTGAASAAAPCPCPLLCACVAACKSFPGSDKACKCALHPG